MDFNDLEILNKEKKFKIKTKKIKKEKAINIKKNLKKNFGLINLKDLKNILY